MENNPRCHIVRSCLLALTQIVGQNEGRVAAVCRVWCVKTLVSLAWCVHSTLLSGCQSRAIKIYRAQLSWRKLKSDLIPHTAAPLTCTITSLLLCARAHLSIRGAESSRRRSNGDSFRTRRANVSYECSYRWADGSDFTSESTQAAFVIRSLRPRLERQVQFKSASFRKHLLEQPGAPPPRRTRKMDHFSQTKSKVIIMIYSSC